MQFRGAGVSEISVLGSLLCCLCCRLDLSAIESKEASTQTIVTTQGRGKKRGRRWCYLVHAKVNTFKKPRLCVQEQQEGEEINLSTKNNVMKGNLLYIDEVQSSLKDCHCYELCLDSARFGSTDTEIIIAQSPDNKKVGFMTPIEQRDLLWRTDQPGAVVAAEDRVAFQKTGFKTKPGMRTYDMIATLNHALAKDFEKSLAVFMLPDMPRLPAGWLRVWNGHRLHSHVRISVLFGSQEP